MKFFSRFSVQVQSDGFPAKGRPRSNGVAKGARGAAFSELTTRRTEFKLKNLLKKSRIHIEEFLRFLDKFSQNNSAGVLKNAILRLERRGPTLRPCLAGLVKQKCK